MRCKTFISLLVTVLISLNLYAQEEDIDETRLFYRSEMSGGLILHTHGFGANFRKAKRKTGFKQRLFSIEIVNIKHPKEYKTSPYVEDSKGFIFGKLNSLTVLRPSIGKQKVLYSKETKRGVQISYILLVGPSLGLVKPVYLEIARPNVSDANKIISNEKYDPAEHQMNMIYGKAPVTMGIDEIKPYPGLHGKFGLNFEYAPLDDLIRAIEAGITIDAFHKKVPIMANTYNSQVFATFYINLQFGKKFF